MQAYSCVYPIHIKELWLHWCIYNCCAVNGQLPEHWPMTASHITVMSQQTQLQKSILNCARSRGASSVTCYIDNQSMLRLSRLKIVVGECVLRSSVVARRGTFDLSSHGGLWARWKVLSSPCLRDYPRRSRGTNWRATHCPTWIYPHPFERTKRGWTWGKPNGRNRVTAMSQCSQDQKSARVARRVGWIISLGRRNYNGSKWAITS